MLTSLINTTTSGVIVHTPKDYHEFHRIQSILTRTTLPFIFIVACIGLITNTATIVLLSRSFVTNNTRQKWTLIALGMCNRKNLIDLKLFSSFFAYSQDQSNNPHEIISSSYREKSFDFF